MGKDKFESHKIRDPIHGFCCLSELECKIIDSPEFQRLRDIKQLWPVNLIYPGAVHTRFEHSIGVCHIAGQIAKNIDLTEEEQQTIRLAALLHDIGHGPFSHVSEDAFKKVNDDELSINEQLLRKHVKPIDSNKPKKHEIVSIETIKDILPRLKECNPDLIINIINLLEKTKGTDFGTLYSIISGPIDSDKMDYLLRDSYYCGVEYGKYDLRRLINSFSCEGKFSRDIVVEDDDVNAIEQFALARYYLYQQVTTHKTTFKAETLFSRAIMMGVQEDLREVCKYYKEANSWIDIRDSDIYNWIRIYSGSQLSKMLSLLLNGRKIPKILYEKEIEGLNDQIKSKTFKEVENLVISELNLKDKNQVIACFHTENDLIKDDEKIYDVTTKSGDRLESRSKVLQVITESNKEEVESKEYKKIGTKVCILISCDDWHNKYPGVDEKNKKKDSTYSTDEKNLDRILAKEV